MTTHAGKIEMHLTTIQAILFTMTYLIEDIAHQIADGSLSARDHIESCLAAIDDKNGQGQNTFIETYHDRARAEADAVDTARKNGWALPPFAGVSLSIKDLFDVAGDVTKAGSILLADSPPALTDATIVARLRQAGFILIGRTNMTEFAFSGLGMNVHYGNPLSPFDRATGRVSGGSSSGSAVSVSDKMATISIGSDTGGSTRAPASYCGIVGLKPSTARMPSDGVFPLSPSFDAAGPMGNSVACVSIIDSIMAGGTGVRETAFTAAGLRLAIPDGYLMADLDTEVATAFDAAIDRLRDAGVHVQKIRLEALEAMRPSNNIKSIVSAEAYRVHRQWLESDQSEKYDPFIERRLRGGADILAADYIDMFEKRDAVYHAIKMQTRGFDALVLPTTPGIAPAINDMPSIDRQIEMNARSLRNTAISNYLDRPTISIPCHKSGTAPVGLSLMGSRHHDRRLLAIADGLETTIRG